MSGSIPASAIVSVTPGVLGAGGTALDLNGLILTANTRVPIGTVPSFPSLAAVTTYFGAGAAEVSLATNYFLGFDNSNKKPGSLLFAQYPWAAPVSAYLRGGNISQMPLATLKALTGVLVVTIDGTVKTSTNIVLTSATSFSSAATIIGTALSAAVSYDAVAGAFVVTSGTTGASSTISIGSGSIAASLMLTQATGAVMSQGAAVATPASAMAGVVAVTRNWCTFTTAFEPVTADKVLFASWANSQDNEFLYACWDTDITPTQSTDTASAGYLIGQAGYSGTSMIYAGTPAVQAGGVAAFLAGAIASIDFTETNGRATMAFRSQSGLMPTVTDQTSAANLIAHGYNFYGQYATANDQFVFFYPGSVSGEFLWIDSYVNQIWLNNQFQIAYMNLLVAVKSIPYNAAGYALIEAGGMDVINQGLNFGAFRPGVTLSSAQVAEVNAAAGVAIATTLQQRGWYLQVLDASPQVRAARGSPPMTFWYMDGQSVQAINLASIEVQ